MAFVISLLFALTVPTTVVAIASNFSARATLVKKLSVVMLYPLEFTGETSRSTTSWAKGLLAYTLSLVLPNMVADRPRICSLFQPKAKTLSRICPVYSACMYNEWTTIFHWHELLIDSKAKRGCIFCSTII